MNKGLSNDNVALYTPYLSTLNRSSKPVKVKGKLDENVGKDGAESCHLTSVLSIDNGGNETDAD